MFRLMINENQIIYEIYQHRRSRSIRFAMILIEDGKYETISMKLFIIKRSFRTKMKLSLFRLIISRIFFIIYIHEVENTLAYFFVPDECHDQTIWLIWLFMLKYVAKYFIVCLHSGVIRLFCWLCSLILISCLYFDFDKVRKCKILF